MYKHSKLCSVLSYITWIGWFVAYFLRDRADSLVRRHLNQALILNLVSLVASYLARRSGVIGIVGELVDLVVLVFAIMGIVRAFKLSEEPLPLIGTIDWVP